LTKLLQK